jgi:hypothetical protein
MLNRLENFLKSSRGKIIYVNNENLDATDSISNGGASPFTPFKSLQRALLEAARYSYQIGNSNDRFNFCSIVVAPGEYFIDNRPGLIINDTGTGYLRNGATATLSQFDLTTVLDITDEENKLYLLNSAYGGVIVPRGTSIIAQDPRKTVFRPLYVPDSRNENIERSAIFRITGASFFWSFSIEDADPTGFCYKNYNSAKFTPNFSHHKLTAFEYVDGVNPVEINDTFLNVTTTRTDLEQYYEKVSLVYGPTSGREIDNVSYIGGVSVDIQPVIDEYRIVGPRGDVIGISSITSGDGITPSSTITVTLDQEAEGISVDTSVQVSGVNVNGYDGQFVVKSVPSSNQIQYITSTVPTVANPAVFGATLNIISDTVSSASPYIFNILLKSVHGMCGLHADGSKVLGFKSVVVAQFTAISLQKDDDAFVIYDEESGNYVDATVVKDLYKNTRSKYKPEFQSYHIKLSNDAFAQLVSVFSIGYAAQIIAEGGGDYSITNSNSNFGAKTFISSGYKNEAFDQDDHGFIVGVIPPEEIEQKTIGIEFPQINIGLTTSVSAGVASTDKLYFYNETNFENPPLHYKDGFRIGAKINDRLNIENPGSASSRIVIPGTNASYQKSFIVQTQNNGFENAINDGVITLTSAHNFAAEEKVRVISQNGHLPDGISPDTVYYIINSTIDNSLSNAQIKLAVTKNNAINNVAILPNRKGGKLSIVSRVSDKVPGEPGHPIQWDSSNNNWYITVSSSDNGIYDEILTSSSSVTGRTYIERTPDNRREENKLYKILYCIPKNTTTAARPPVNGFILQESNDSSLSGTEFNKYFGATDLAVDTEIRNPKFISTASWNSNEVTISTELSHKLNTGDLVEINNVIPVAYNGTFTVTKTPSSRSFTYELLSNPGIFSNNTRVRNSDLPYVKRKNTRNIFRIFKSEETQKFIRNKQDGLYGLTVVHTSVKPTIEPFTDNSFSQPVQNLYPRLDRDNPDSDPNQTSCFAEHNVIGNVLVDDTQNSISKEAVNKFNSDLNIGIGITSIISNNIGTAHTIYTSVDHGLSKLVDVSLVSAGSSYITGTYYGVGTATTFNGQSASFKVVIDGSQSVSEVEIMSGGSNYSIGDILSITSGIGTTTGFVPATIEVTEVTDPVNRVISLSNYVGDFVGYNDSFVITGINNSKSINVASASTIAGFSTTLISRISTGFINGEVLSVTSFTYDNVSGIATVSTTFPHGLKENTKIRLSGFNQSFYNKDVFITSINSLTQLEVNIGKFSSIPPTTGTRIIIPLGILPINSKSRLTYYYSDIIANSGLQLNVDDDGTITFNIVNARFSGLKKGDYIEVNGEIMRIKSDVDSDFVGVYRSQFGSEKKTHLVGSVIRKINVVPVELRRNSIIRASGQTFEYVGYGAGNYSTSLPENQDREIEREESLISKSTKDSGGTVYYGGMDENGDFYSANRKFSSATGEQQVYDLPIPTVVSESSIEDSFNFIETEKAIVSGSIKVGGGQNGDIISQFNGPVVLSKKLTSYSQEGIEAAALFLKGDQKVSRKYSVSNTIPSNPGNYGDIVYKASPSIGENIGWVYTLQDEWRSWGYVGDLDTQLGLYSGTEFGPNSLEGIIDELKIVGDPSGFGINVDMNVDATSGFGTVVIRTPVSAGLGLTVEQEKLNVKLDTNDGGIKIDDDGLSVDDTVIRGLQANATVVILHVAEGTPLTGPDSVPAGYPTENHDYIPGGPGLRGLLFNSVTEAIRKASTIFVPVGAEIVISVHNDLNSAAPEAGPLILSNSTANYVVAGARGATNPTVYLNRTVTKNASEFLLDSPGYFYSVGAIFQDLNLDVNENRVVNGEGDVTINIDNRIFGGILTFNGGFGIVQRSLNIRWRNVGRNSIISNATAGYGERVVFRFFSSLVPGGNDLNFNTEINFINNSIRSTDNPEIRMITELGGLYGQGINILFDLKFGDYGQSSPRNNTFTWRFDHSGSSTQFRPVILRFLGCGGRGGCKLGSRLSPALRWNFNGNDWDLSNMFSPFIERNNYCGRSFQTLAGGIAQLSANTRSTIGFGPIGSKVGYTLDRGASIDGYFSSDPTQSSSGPFSLLFNLQGTTLSGVTVPDPIIIENPSRGSYLY